MKISAVLKDKMKTASDLGVKVDHIPGVAAEYGDAAACGCCDFLASEARTACAHIDWEDTLDGGRCLDCGYWPGDPDAEPLLDEANTTREG